MDYLARLKSRSHLGGEPGAAPGPAASPPEKSTAHTQSEPTKPTKPSFVGSVGPDRVCGQEISRPYRLAQAAGDAAHAEPWNDGAIARFQARTRHIRRLGFAAQDADDLAERLHLRDVHADYRHLCVECRHYRPHRCGNHRTAALTAADVGRDLATMFQHCPGFSEVL